MCAAVNSSPSSSPSTLALRGQQTLSPNSNRSRDKSYDYLLKFLLVGDSDVGKEELLSGMDDGASESPYGYASSGIDYKTTTILLDGKRVKLQLWVTSGQGRFCTILRSYSRGAQGILLVYDITNKWSFDGIDRWIKEIDEHAPGVPKILVGNRLHLAFRRQISEACAEQYAEKNNMAFFEVSPLCDFNVTESFAELSRLALKRNGMSRAFGFNKVLSLQELACRTVVSCTTIYGIEQLPLPNSIKSHLKSYALTNKTRARMLSFVHRDRHKKVKYLNPCESPPTNCRKSCILS
ncbi:ras-related protein Rab-40B-like [Physella acuta]|uniref:ras-related protein Rab-40B-like n=1 Tax=Physella acuta TaxID=109671 RepID=UPI0027DC3237|nr:ras-related protein Rab-40B-like [Physella acuta]